MMPARRARSSMQTRPPQRRGGLASSGSPENHSWHASRTPEVEQSGRDESRNIDPVYRPSDDGAIVVYAGDLQLAIGADKHVLPGNLELRLSPRPEFSALLPAATPG